MKNYFLFVALIVTPLFSFGQQSGFYASKAWSDFVDNNIFINDTIIAIGSGYAEYRDSEWPKVCKKIIVLYPNADADWIVRQVDVGKNDTVFSKSYPVSGNKNFIRSNFKTLRELFFENAGFKGINISGSGAISFYMKVGDEVVYENYFHNGRSGINSYLETDLELFFLYYSIGNNTVP